MASKLLFAQCWKFSFGRKKEDMKVEVEWNELKKEREKKKEVKIWSIALSKAVDSTSKV